MVIAWVLSLLVLLASLLGHLEHLLALEMMALNTFEQSAQKMIASEKSLVECEQHLFNLTTKVRDLCHVQSAGKNLWLISTKEKPSIEVLVFLDDRTHLTSRLSWRQKFD